MLRSVFILYVLLASCLITAAQRDTVSLNADWQFVADKQQKGFEESWFGGALPASHPVQLPHTWNIEDSNQQHYGWGWYQKKLIIPAAWKNKNLVIRFGAVNHTCIIYVNGVIVAENTGDGFNAFRVNLNGKVKYGKENIITVAVNNDFGRNKVPFGSSFDWPNDGGLIRKVMLIVSDKPAVAWLHVEPILNTVTHAGKLRLRIGFDGSMPGSELQAAVTVTEENQPTRQIVYASTLPLHREKEEAVTELELPAVHPWHFDYPDLYRVDVELITKKKTTDRISALVGFREIKTEDGKFYLNGERIRLMGVEWTSGSNPDYGFAETDSVILSQCKLMKAVNAIFTRQHFQQDDLFYDFCDRNGILVQQEVPLWGPETPASDTIRQIAMQQLERMISNYYNHPCIYSWGAGNELRARDTGMKSFINELLNKARELDPSRKVAYVSNTLTQSFYNNPTFTPDAAAAGDYIMMNEYGGSWWTIPSGSIAAYLDSVHLSYPDKPFFISEFGLCEPNFKGGDQRRAEDLIYHMAVFESKAYVEGAIYFDLTDYRTHYPGTAEENRFRRRIHGVYDMYGQPKSSMQVLRELSSPVEVQQVRKWKKGKLNVLLFGSTGLPQYTVRGYTLVVSATSDYSTGKKYALPDILPGQQLNVETDELSEGQVFITVLRPNGYVVSQKSF